jgi:hypothetical protein
VVVAVVIPGSLAGIRTQVRLGWMHLLLRCLMLMRLMMMLLHTVMLLMLLRGVQ